MSEVVLLGGGGHARVLASVLRRLGTLTVLGYTDTSKQEGLCEISYLGTDSVIASLLHDRPSLRGVLAVGSVGEPTLRRSIAERASRAGLEFPVVVSPAALVNEGVFLGAGTVVLDGAVVNVGAKIGAFGIVNTNSTVEHDCRLGDYVHIAPGATLSGGVRIGDDVLVGAGAVVVQSVSVCSGVILGAGTVVIDDIEESGTYVGNPARKVR